MKRSRVLCHSQQRVSTTVATQAGSKGGHPGLTQSVHSFFYSHVLRLFSGPRLPPPPKLHFARPPLPPTHPPPPTRPPSIPRCATPPANLVDLLHVRPVVWGPVFVLVHSFLLSSVSLLLLKTAHPVIPGGSVSQWLRGSGR